MGRASRVVRYAYVADNDVGLWAAAAVASFFFSARFFLLMVYYPEKKQQRGKEREKRIDIGKGKEEKLTI